MTEVCECGHIDGLHPMLDWDTGKRGQCLSDSDCECQRFRLLAQAHTPPPLLHRLVLAAVEAHRDGDPFMVIGVGDGDLRIMWKSEKPSTDPAGAGSAENRSPEPPVCANCDGRKCLACVYRQVHQECLDDCPSCDEPCDPPKAHDPHDAEDAWRQADDSTPTRFRVTANIYHSPFEDEPYTQATWQGTRFQIGERAGEFAEGIDNPLLHMEVATVEVVGG